METNEVLISSKRDSESCRNLNKPKTLVHRKKDSLTPELSYSLVFIYFKRHSHAVIKA